MQGAYVQHGDRLYQVPWPEERMYAWKNFVHQDRLARRACQIFLLKMKANGKELDPRHFSPDEKVQDDKSDEAEWLSWIRNKVVQLVPPERAKKVPRNRIFHIPLRWVRVNKNKEIYAAVVVPGHADPGLGEYRSDGPTTTPCAVRMLETLAMSKGWVLHVFDVATAFLSGTLQTGRSMSRRLLTAFQNNLPPFLLLHCSRF